MAIDAFKTNERFNQNIKAHCFSQAGKIAYNRRIGRDGSRRIQRGVDTDIGCMHFFLRDAQMAGHNAGIKIADGEKGGNIFSPLSHSIPDLLLPGRRHWFNPGIFILQ